MQLRRPDRISAYNRMAHLLRRAAFGASPDEINNYLRQGLEATVNQLLDYDETPEAPNVPLEPSYFGGRIQYESLGTYLLAGWWLDVILKTRRPLRERMVLFWHDHFATSFDKVNAPNGAKHLYWQNQLERHYATGNFRDLMKGMDRDPAMMRWLDNDLNTKASPNENYARELMEIFMLGFEAFTDGVYTEPDVQQAARAYTAWRLKRNFDQPANFLPNGAIADPALVIEIPPRTDDGSPAAQDHDYGDKTVFGVTANFNGSDIVDLILDREPQRSYCARMLARKLFEYFAYEDPEPKLIERLAEVLKQNDFNIKPLLRELFLNTPEFYSLKALRALVKDPVYFTVNALRVLKAPEPDGNGLIEPLREMGQELFYPPDVFGWPGGTDWFSTARMFARMTWANTMTSNRSPSSGIPLHALLADAGLGVSARPEQVVDYFTAVLIQAPLPAPVRQALIEYLLKADNGQVGAAVTFNNLTIDKKLRGLVHLLLARPEAQVF